MIALLRRALPFAPLGLVAAVVVAAVTRGLGVALLVLAAGLLLLAIAALWQSVQSLGDDGDLSLDEALALAAPSAEEEKKRSVLRALKDLEYERSVGKVSEEDYATLSAQYRDEARRLLQELNKSELPARKRVEELVARRLEREAHEASKKGKPPAPAPEPEEDSDEPEAEEAAQEAEAQAEDADEESSPTGERATCTECGTKNEADARFCKQCGESLG